MISARTAERLLWLAIAAVILLWLVSPASAQPPSVCPARPTCDPLTTLDRAQCGALTKGRTAAGEWHGYWHPVYKTDAEWWWCPFVVGVLDKYRATTPQGVVAIAEVVAAGPSVIDGVMTAITKFRVAPPPGTQDEYQFALLFHAACESMGKQAPNPAGWTPGYVYTCEAPTPPPAPVVVWRVAPTALCGAADKDLSGRCLRRPTYAWDGAARASAPAPEKADVGALCNQAVGVGGFHGVLGRADRVAPCQKQ